MFFYIAKAAAFHIVVMSCCYLRLLLESQHFIFVARISEGGNVLTMQYKLAQLDRRTDVLHMKNGGARFFVTSKMVTLRLLMLLSCIVFLRALRFFNCISVMLSSRSSAFG